MRTSTKRVIFFSLLLLFAVYSFFIMGSVTNFKKGTSALTIEAKQGKLVFQKYNCIACHQVYGLGGYLGPDLTNVTSGPGKGKEYIHSLLKYGTTRMPDFNLSDDEISDLMAYLNYLDKTGKSPVKEFTLNINGTYSCGNDEK
jgi:nitric oxide reductase subunit C